MRDRPTVLRHSILAVLIAAIVVGTAIPVWAGLSDYTGKIEGRLPTTTGDQQVLMPDMATDVTNGVTVSQTDAPDQFLYTQQYLNQVTSDADGDTGFMTQLDPNPVMVWRHNGVELIGAQLTTPLYDNFPGSTVTLEVIGEDLTTTQTGFPRWNTTYPVTTYTLNVPAVPVPMPASIGINASNYTFRANVGFPSTGFDGAKFTIFMNGSSIAANSQYTWAVTTGNWLSVNNGVVTFNAKPSAAQRVAVISATDSAGKIYEYRVAPSRWVKVKTTTPPSNANDYCSWNYGQSESSCPQKLASPATYECAAYPGYTMATAQQGANISYSTAGGGPGIGSAASGRGVGAPAKEWGNLLGGRYHHGEGTFSQSAGAPQYCPEFGVPGEYMYECVPQRQGYRYTFYYSWSASDGGGIVYAGSRGYYNHSATMCVTGNFT